jgi:UDP-N-acetylglucosamine diphosphorylase / glucose-1-phosphate thymidylyltransferase / UDP-N-acetylgalactosamine diphosphorylase / glucosamine-1-phosphate N-acetyltransferase / galactosamine-1-phosphate N-acetyltransferase
MNTKPTIVIIAGGKSSRFFPLDTKTHKGFFTLGGKPIIYQALESIVKNGFTDVVIVMGQRDFDNEELKDQLNDFENLNIQIVLQSESKGQGNALLSAKDYLNEHFILASPYYFNLGEIAEELWQKKQESDADCIFSGTKTDTPELYGILDLDENDKNKVTGVTEKPPRGSEKSNFKIDSVYLFDKDFINELNSTDEKEYSLETAITAYAQKKNITWVENHRQIQSLKYPWHLFSIFKQIMYRKKSFTSESAQVSDAVIIDQSEGAVIIDDEAKIGNFVKLVGPCYVGKNCLVGDYSFVRGSSLEEGSVVGANTEVVRSILLEGASIHYSYLADSILGHNTKVGAGLITANKRLDRENIMVMVKNKLIDTTASALGLITGENTTLGIRVNSMPGTLIEANSQIMPGETIKRNVNNES